MRLAVYAIVLSIVYAAVALVNDEAGRVLLLAFIAAIVVPAVAVEWRHVRRPRR